MSVGIVVRLCGLMLIAGVVGLTVTHLRQGPAARDAAPQWAIRTVSAAGHRAILARLDAVRGRNWAGRPVQLVLRCEDGHEADAYVDWGSVISTGAPPEMRWRAGRAGIVAERWITSLDGATTFAHDPGAFIATLHTHRQLWIQVRDQAGRARLAAFDLDDADRALAPLRADCKLR